LNPHAQPRSSPRLSRDLHEVKKFVLRPGFPRPVCDSRRLSSSHTHKNDDVTVFHADEGISSTQSHAGNARGIRAAPPSRYRNAYSHLSSFLLNKRRSSGVYPDQVSGLRKSSRVFAVDNQHHGPEANNAVATTTDGFFLRSRGRKHLYSISLPSL